MVNKIFALVKNDAESESLQKYSLTKNGQLISIILPIYNEAENISLIYIELSKIFERLDCYNFEIIFVNDGSSDESWNLISKLAESDKRITSINFSRNFGHQMALTAGYDYAHGDAIITMDADLQDPPQLIIEMLKKWDQGFQIVYARRTDRKDSFLKKITAQWYYLLLDKIADVHIPRNVGDFRLIDKKVLTTIRNCREKSRYLRGMVAWSGFRSTYVDFNRSNRHAGKTGYTWAKMIKLAFDGMTGFSLFPLRLAAFIGIFVIATGGAMLLFICCDTFFYGIYYPLFKWLTTIMYIFMGIQFLLMWILGEYIGRIFEQQKGRPLYIIDDVVNQEKMIASLKKDRNEPHQPRV
ncbi:glycosyltransferase family 2 protein [Candidatus Dependentiae bacterium]|nr:glycosyltransferase family 2 protein [Candidatus Dependentiae bacterium]